MASHSASDDIQMNQSLHTSQIDYRRKTAGQITMQAYSMMCCHGTMLLLCEAYHLFQAMEIGKL